MQNLRNHINASNHADIAVKDAEAREKFVEASKANKYNLNALFLAAVMEIKLKMYDDAEGKLQFLAHVAPNEGNSYEYAKLMFLKNNYDDALFYADKALDFNKNMLPAYLLKGEIYRLRYDEENSLANYKKAEELSLIAPNLFTIEDINEYNHLLPYIQSFCDILITSYMSCFVCLPIAMNVV